jgi:transcriptional regulator with XRE-family HTH domain
MIGAMPSTDPRQEGVRMARKKRETFGNKLARLREAAGVSQYALAKMTGLTNQAVTYLEAGERQPTWETVQRLAKALGLDCTAFADEGLVLPVYKPGKPGRKPKQKGK